ncbi:MAG: cadmium-translocating P-type ATPase [Clostridia bacterium]|nr:cadmium-translocating P-type ATPase [Clostridia bacterium]
MSCQNGKCNKTEELEEKDKIEKSKIILYVVSIVIFTITFIPGIQQPIKIVLSLASILLAGYELLWEGILNIFKLNFEEDTLMAIAIVSSCLLGEFREGCLVVLLFELGEFIESIAMQRSHKNIENIANMQAKTANLLQEDGSTVTTKVEKIKIGDTILIKPGEMVPVDCKVMAGTSEIDTSNLTGESRPIIVKEQEELLSGVMNLTGSLQCEVIRTFENSTASQIVDLVYEATNNKGKTEKFITRFSKIYTPIIIILALAIAIIPWLLGANGKDWLMRALVFLVASCPCSIVISVPLAFFSCVGAVSKKGMVIKGTKHIENLAKASIICFDKTGTITNGKMEIKELKMLENYSEEEALSFIASLENQSNHPIANSVKQEIQKRNLQNNLQIVENQKEIAGQGIYGEIEGKGILLGNEKLLESYQIAVPEKTPNEAILLAINGKVVAYLTLKEEIRSGLERFAENLKNVGIKQTIMLTGDTQEKAKQIAEQIGITKIESGLLPNSKLEKVEELKKHGKVIFVGDGINDSPVLAAADFSIAMGEGTEIASDTADSILISNQLSVLPKVISIAQKTMKIVYANIIFSLLVKLIVLTLGILGLAPVWLAVFADVGVTFLTVLNSIRIYGIII